MNKELIIDASESEITIALLEEKKLVEITREKSNKSFSVGDLYLGRVKKIKKCQAERKGNAIKWRLTSVKNV